MTFRYSITKRMGSFIMALVIVVSVIGVSAGKDEISEAEIQRRLKKINKPAVKSIQSADGDIIDCVKINEKPAFDHPLLKNHTIQMRPDSYPEGTFITYNASSGENKQEDVITQLWHENGECPDNTVPIKRTTKEDLLRAHYFDANKKRSPNNISHPRVYIHDQQLGEGHEYAIVSHTGSFHGAKARLNVWKPHVQERGEFSLSQIWILNGNVDNDLNTIEAGWQVDPLRGDNNPKLFIFWTADSYRNTGCYNHECPGFVQISKKIAFGGSIHPISNYGGVNYEISLQIWKGRSTGYWWLQYGQEVVGYWPGSVVPNLSDFAREIQFGGEIVNHRTNGQHTTTQMGSGHFAQEMVKKASFISNLQVMDIFDNLVDIPPKRLGVVVTNPNCYNLMVRRTKIRGTFILFGGPGRNPRCP